MAAIAARFGVARCIDFSATTNGCVVCGDLRSWRACPAKTPPHPLPFTAFTEKTDSVNPFAACCGGETPQRRLISTACGLLFNQKIIGHRVAGAGLLSVRRSCAFGGNVGVARRMFHQQPRQAGVRALLDIAVQQLLDLLSQIRGVIKPRQLIALQAVSRGGKEKIPRRLGRMIAIQGALPGNNGATLPLVH